MSYFCGDTELEPMEGGYVIAGILAVPLGLLPFNHFFRVIFDWKWGQKYRQEGNTIFGDARATSQRVIYQIDGTYTIGSSGLTIEYNADMGNGEINIIQKKCGSVSKKTTACRTETGQIELLVLPSRGPYSAYPRDMFYPSKSDCCCRWFCTILGTVFYLLCLYLGLSNIMGQPECYEVTPTKLWTVFAFFLAVLGLDFGIAFYLYCKHVRTVVSSGKVLRHVPQEFRGSLISHLRTSTEERQKKDGPQSQSETHHTTSAYAPETSASEHYRPGECMEYRA